MPNEKLNKNTDQLQDVGELYEAFQLLHVIDKVRVETIFRSISRSSFDATERMFCVFAADLTLSVIFLIFFSVLLGHAC